MTCLKENKSLPVILHELSNFINNEVGSAKKDKTLSPFKETYVKTNITDFKYDKRITGFSSNHENVTKDMWPWGTGLTAVEDKVKASEPFQAAVKEIAKIYNLGTNQAESKILTFVTKIAYVCLDEINNGKVIELVTLFLDDLNETPISWRPIVWIDGVWMETDSLKILDHVLLRKPEPTDLEYEFPTGMEFYEREYHRNWPSAILECEYREKFPDSVRKNIDSVICSLRLFRVGSIERLSIQWNASSILMAYGGRVVQSDLVPTPYRYGLTKEDTDSLRDFVTEIEPLVHSEIIDKTIEESDYLSIAYDRYCGALLKHAVPESRLATAMMALEALYLKKDEHGELTERLSLRVAIALEPFGYNPPEVYKRVRRAYGIRSDYVHGSKVEQKDIANRAETILDYCRISILIFLQMRRELDKEKMIKLLSESILDSDKKKEYRDKMGGKYPIH